jgi:hypothetical protein
MSIEQKVDEITKKIQEIELQVTQIKNRTAPDAYLQDYSINCLYRIISELEKAIEFLDKDENLVDHLKVKRYLEEFSSRLAPLTLMFELYFVFRIAHLFWSMGSNPTDLIILDRTLHGFYHPEELFEGIDEKDYKTLRGRLSGLKSRFEEISSVWTGTV